MIAPPQSPPSAIGRSRSPAVVAAALACLAGATPATAPDRGLLGMNHPGRQPLLVAYYSRLGEDGDLDAFRQRVEARYGEAALCRLLSADEVRSRRAAVTALGLIGSFEVNEALATALRDEDRTVRDLASHSLWSVWFRADTPEHEAILRQLADLAARRDGASLAIRDLSILIERAPGFAEAYNQRAVAAFTLGRYAESAADCRRVLELNPYHFGALSGLARCYLNLGRPDLALSTFRRALELQPHDWALRQAVDLLEAGSP